MIRYIGFIWDPRDSELEREVVLLVRKLQFNSRPWLCTLDTHGTKVFCETGSCGAEKIVSLHNESGVVLGQLFEKSVDGRMASVRGRIDAGSSTKIIDTCGQTLIGSYWGRYVAFLRSKSLSRAFIIRDPSGGIPCKRTEENGVHIYFSHLEDAVELIDGGVQIDWRYIVAVFQEYELVNRKTALCGMEEVLPGECHEICRGDLVRTLYWDPRNIARSGMIFDRHHAESALVQAVQGCVSGWGSIYDRILHNLSGGLDSAIVLSCLANAPARPEVVCLNYYTRTLDGDERKYARLAAERAGYELIERELPGYSTRLEDLVMMTPISERPTTKLFGWPSEIMQMEIARERKLAAFTSGEGGDHMFFAFKEPIVAADYVYLNGLRPAFMKIVFENAKLSKTSIWPILANAFAYGLFRQRWSAKQAFTVGAPAFLKVDALLDVPIEYTRHPWSTDLKNIPEAKAAQLYALPKVLGRQSFFGRVEVGDVIHPLFSQPIVETCLRIPVYILEEGGEPRGLAKQAFAEHVPPEILKRKSKGATTRYFSRILSQNMPFIREFVLGGILAQESFIDEVKLEMLLNVEALEEKRNLLYLVKLFAVEAWLRKQKHVRTRVAV